MAEKKAKKGSGGMAAPTLKAKKRLLFLMTAIIVLLTGLAVKMGIIIFVQGEQLQQKALLQQTRDLVVAAKRGEILDCNGNVLAQSANAQAVVVRPAEISEDEVDAVVNVLAEVLEIDEETVRSKVTDISKSEIWLKRQVSNDVADQLRDIGMPGVYFTVDIKRYYTNSAFLTQTLGFTSVDGSGQEGIEAYFDRYLSGQDGRIMSETDRDGRAVALGEEEYIAPIDGYNVVLTVDEVIQSFLEQALEEAYYQQNAKSAYGIAMDPATGEILAIANVPDYDLNDVPRDDIPLLTELTRNKVITDIYEPGSTFKVVTLASALDSGKVTVDTSFDCAGSYVVDGQMIKCWRYPNSHGHQTLAEAVQNSCNVAFMKMGLAMETETFYDYIYKFGLGQETGITFPSDSGGIVMAEKYVTNGDLARIAFGQSIAVTPLQLISSFCAVVNGGFLFEPALVKGIQDSDGGYIDEYEPEVVSQPITAETSAIAREILESVVTEGSGKNCYIPGYRIGGKTGTAQKYDENHNVMHDKVIASFIAFAPVDDPQIAVLIVVDEPDVGVTFGSVVAAPYVRSVLDKSLQYMGIEPNFDEAEAPAEVTVPDVTGQTLNEADSALVSAGLKWLADGTGTVLDQLPAPGATVDAGTSVWLYMDTEVPYDEMEGMVVVPDLTGLDMTDAAQLLEERKLLMSIQGQGVVTYQSPAADELVPEGTKIMVRFSGG